MATLLSDCSNQAERMAFANRLCMAKDTSEVEVFQTEQENRTTEAEDDAIREPMTCYEVLRYKDVPANAPESHINAALRGIPTFEDPGARGKTNTATAKAKAKREDWSGMRAVI